MAFSRTAPAETTAAAPKTNPGGTMKGLAGFEHAEAIQRQRDLKKYIPYDYKLAQADPTNDDPRYRRDQPEEGEVILLDGEEICWRYAHEVGKGRDKRLVVCPQEFEKGCPLCAGMKGDTPRVMILTCMDLRQVPKKDKDGNVKRDAQGNVQYHDFTRKKMVVKKQSQGLFKDIFVKNGGTFRGAHLHMKRQPGDTSAAIGHPTYIERVTDEEIVENFPDPEIKNAEGKVLRKEGENRKVMNYDLLFPIPSVAELIREFGGTAVPGSRAANGEFGTVNRGTQQPTQTGGMSAPEGEQGPEIADDDIPFN